MKGIRERKEETNTTHALPDPTSDWNTKISLLRQRKRRRSILSPFIWQKERVSFVSFDEATLFSFISHFFSPLLFLLFPLLQRQKMGKRRVGGGRKGTGKGKLERERKTDTTAASPHSPSSLLFRIKVGGERGEENFLGLWGEPC